MTDPKETLVRYLQIARDSVLWKLEGLSEYDVRRPMTPTGTNLLGLVKHLASVELGYFGDTFGRPHGLELPWQAEGADPNADMFATEDESREQIIGYYKTAWEHAAGTFAAKALDDIGEVPWWQPERRRVTLHTILVHMTAETDRHAGHADIVREMIDHKAGLRPEATNLPDAYDWNSHYARLERIARAFATEADLR
jgi:hypothetical protein